jgi:hypothetical protein
MWCAQNELVTVVRLHSGKLLLPLVMLADDVAHVQHVKSLFLHLRIDELCELTCAMLIPNKKVNSSNQSRSINQCNKQEVHTAASM